MVGPTPTAGPHTAATSGFEARLISLRKRNTGLSSLLGGWSIKSCKSLPAVNTSRLPTIITARTAGTSPRLNQRGRERAVHISGDGVLLLWPIQLDCKDAAFACGQDIHGIGTSI